MPGSCEMARHRCPHDAKPDEADLHFQLLVGVACQNRPCNNNRPYDIGHHTISMHLLSDGDPPQMQEREPAEGCREGGPSCSAVSTPTPVPGLDHRRGRVASVRLATGETVACGTLVNAAGPRARQVAAMAGLSIPVAPCKRYSFVFASANPIPGRMPNVTVRLCAQRGNSSSPTTSNAFRRVRRLYLAGAVASYSGLRRAEGPNELDRPLRIQHARPQRHCRLSPRGEELDVRQRRPAGRCRSSSSMERSRRSTCRRSVTSAYRAMSRSSRNP